MFHFRLATLLTLALLEIASLSWAGSRYIRLKKADGFRGSHTAAAATALAYARLSPANQPEKVFIGSLAGQINHCLCERPDKPMAFWIKEGVETYAGFSGLSLKIEEKVKHSTNPSEQVSFEDYKRSIDSKKPVILTFLKGPEPADALATARHRLKGFSAVGVGYAEESGKKYLIALDWETKVPEGAIHPNPPGGPWQKEKARWYDWDGPWDNIVMVFVEKATPKKRVSLDKPQTISPEELHELQENRRPLIVIDARPPDEFTKGHISGAINITPQDISKAPKDISFDKVPRGHAIVVYCCGPDCSLSERVATFLLAKGFSSVYRMNAGYPAWVSAGYPIEPNQ